LYARKKASVPLADWIASHERNRAKQPAWAQNCKSVPSTDTLRRWHSDCGCETPSGDWTAPDGVGPDGAPSWLRLFAMI
jgi:hypothetical protein